MHISRPRVVMLCGSRPPEPCGVGDYADRLARALNELGEYECVLAPDPTKNGLSSEARFSIFNASKLAGQLIDKAPDVIHIQYPTVGYGKTLGVPSLPGALRKLGYAKPIVSTIHEYSHAHFLRKMAIGPLVRESDRIITPSHQERDALKKGFNKLKKEPPTVIPVGPVLPDGFRLESMPDDISRNPAYYGFINKSKGFEVVLDALKLLKEKGDDITLKVIGHFDPENDKLHARLKNRIEELSIEGMLNFTGHLPLNDVFHHLARARFLIFPFPDGFSYRRSSLISALPLGRPILTTFPKEAEGMEDISGSMQLVKRGDAESLAEGMHTLQRNDFMLESLGSGSLKLAGMLSFENAARKHGELYMELLLKKL